MNGLNQAGCCRSHGFCHIVLLYHSSSQSGQVRCFSPTTWNFRLVPALQVFLEVHITRFACSGMGSIKLVQLITWICHVAWPFYLSHCRLMRHFSPNTWNYRLVPVSRVFCVVHSTRLVCVGMDSIKLVLSIACCSSVPCVFALNSYYRPIRCFSPARSIYSLAFAQEPSFLLMHTARNL
jgi:hypothetical protein